MFWSATMKRPETTPFRFFLRSSSMQRDTYRALVKRFGIDKTYILSAGWGLIPASFLTPYYDITFTGECGRLEAAAEERRLQ